MLTFTPDSYINDKTEYEVVWIATLSNGQTVYYDDDRPGLEENSTWKRLKKYCQDNELSIVSFKIKFRSHVEYLPSNADGYYFSKKILGSFAAENLHFWLTGWVENGILRVKTYKLPELLEIESEFEHREIEPDDERLILNHATKIS